MLDVLPKRFGKYGLTPPPGEDPAGASSGRAAAEGAKGRPAGLRLAGLHALLGRSRKGNWVVKRKTAASRLRRTLKRSERMVPEHRHQPVAWQHEQLVQAARALRLLRDHRRTSAPSDAFVRASRVSGASGCRAARAARRSPGSDSTRLLKRYPLPAPAVHRTRLVSRSEPVDRGAGCGKSARPDLWGAGRATAPVYPEELRLAGRRGIRRAPREPAGIGFARPEVSHE